MIGKRLLQTGKRGIALIVSLLIILSAFAFLPALMPASAEDTNVNYLEVKSGSAWSSIIYQAQITFAARGYYRFSFDYKEISGEPVFNLQGYDSANENYRALSDFCSSYAMDDTVQDGICKRIITLRVKPTSFTGLKITIGAYDEKTDISCAFANPELYRYTNSTYETHHSSTPDSLLKDLSIANIYDVMAEDPTHKSNKDDMWNLRYLTGKRGTLVHGSLTLEEYSDFFAPPKYMIRLYEGNQNTVAEYIDKNIDLQPGTYVLSCHYKTTLETADFTVAVSSDNGETFQNADATVTDSENSKRQVQFTLSEAANGLKIALGNLTDRTDVSVAFADPVLQLNGEGDNLIQPITAATSVLIGTEDVLTEKVWNVRRDAENTEAVGIVSILENYFADKKESLVYETNAGFPWTRIEYTENSVVLKAGKKYLFTADFKLKSGTLPNDQIGVTNDPLVGILVDTLGKAGYGKDIYLSSKNADYFNELSTVFDEAQGKIFIRFSPKDDLAGAMFRIGNFCETPVGSCAIANPTLTEYSTKTNDVTVFGDTMIKNITEDTVVNPKEGKSANSELGKWNTINLNNTNSFHVGSIEDGYFEPEDAYIKIQSSSSNAKVEYTDHSTVFNAGTRYQLSFNYRVYSGEPEAVLSFKNIGGVEGVYTALTDTADFIDNFNDQTDEVSFVRTITFTPKKDLSDLKLAIGALSGQENVSVAIAGAECFALTKGELKTGENLLTKINRPNIRRNTAEEKIWNLISTKDSDIIYTAPIPKGTFAPSKMVRIKTGYSWNRAVYYDDALIIEPNTTYRFSVDYIAGSGSPSFSMTFNHPETNKRTNIATLAATYKTWLDKRVSMRYIEFTTKSDLGNLRGIEITIGNSTESTDVSCVFANPTFTKVVDGESVGDNLIYNINDRTVQYMGTMMYNGVWNLRYQGNKNVALVLEDIPENYFRIPAFETENSVGSLTQFVTAKAGTSYLLAFRFKNEGGSDCVPYIEGYSASGSLGQISYDQITRDTDGYYNFKCEFKTPANLRETNNIRVGIMLDGVIGAYTGFEMYELDSGFEKTGSNLIKNGSFANIRTLPVYDGNPSDVWSFEGSENHAAASYRTISYFKIAVPQVYLFAGGSEGNYFGRTLELTASESYRLSFNLKYANPGYEGDTGVELSYKNGTEWVTLPADLSESTTDFESTYTFTMPADAASGQNMRFRVKVGSYYVSGCFANATLVNVNDTTVNLIDNGDFANGTDGWERGGNFRQTYLYELPDNYFKRDRFKDSMIIYRNSGEWDNIDQNYLALKSDTYYMLVSEAVHPWPDESEIGQESLLGHTDYLGSTFGIQVSYFDEEGKRQQPFLAKVKKTEKNRKSTAIYKTPSNMETGSNTHFRMIMQDAGDAGFWGSFALYECNENGEILSNNVLLNSDFALGTTAWTFSQRDENFTCRIVKQPDGFFENYKKNGPNMVESTGTGKDAILGQTVTVQRGTQYYFTGFYAAMNSAGITPKVLYKDKNGKTQEYTTGFYYDPDRFYFELPFTLPDDAYADRGSVDVQFIITNSDQGKGYLSDLMLYKEGEYINLVTNGDFSNKLAGWTTTNNYKLLPYDAGVFVFHFNDKAFDDGNWAGTETGLQKGQIAGLVFDQNGNPFEGITLTLTPGKLTAKTNADGQYTFKNLQAGTYKLSIKDPAGKVHFVTEVTVRDGMSSMVSMLTITLNQDSDGNVEDVTAEENTSDQNMTGQNDTTDSTDQMGSGSDNTENGFSGSESNNNASDDGNGSAITKIIRRVKRIRRQTDQSDEWDLDDTETITDETESNEGSGKKNYGVVCGYLFDANGKPIKGRAIYIGRLGKVTTKEKGVFQFNNVPPGEYDVYVVNTDRSITVLKRVKVVAGKGSIYKLRLPGEAENAFPIWLIIVIIAGGVALLGGSGFTAFVLIKKRK